MDATTHALTRAPKERLQACLLLSGLLALLGACAGPGRKTPSPHPAAGHSRTQSLPPWYGLTGWNRLDQIEGWLNSNGPVKNQQWISPARLALADGLLDIEDASGEHLHRRRERAKGLYSTVSTDLKATDQEKQHAAHGLRRADSSGVPRSQASAQLTYVLPRSAWRARPARPHDMTPATGPWKYITVHHSALSATDGTAQDQAARDVRTVQNGHMGASRAYGDVGYHFLIDAGGRVWQGRELRWQGAHAGGSNNEGNIGICLLGDFDKIRPTGAALSKLDRLVSDLHRVTGVPLGRVRGHKDWKSTNCPGKHLEGHVSRLR